VSLAAPDTVHHRPNNGATRHIDGHDITRCRGRRLFAGQWSHVRGYVDMCDIVAICPPERVRRPPKSHQVERPYRRDAHRPVTSPYDRKALQSSDHPEILLDTSCLPVRHATSWKKCGCDRRSRGPFGPVSWLVASLGPTTSMHVDTTLRAASGS